jgi:hypothetical protein
VRSLDQIGEARDVILQIERTNSTFRESQEEAYLCEVVNPADYDRKGTADKLTDELVRVNNDNRTLRRRIERLEKNLQAKMEGK